MALLEREAHLAELHRAATDAATGRGRTVLVTGEAGIGKTSLVEAFARDVESSARVLWGACEALFTPRPLGPFYDIVHELGGPLLARLEGDAKHIDLFYGLLHAIRQHDTPSVMVLEDVHWADHASLDFIRFFGRRIHKAPAVLVLTFRDDEVGADHPLTAILGELPTEGRIQLRLPVLSRVTVERLARDAGRIEPDMYRVTNGNPFFVTELLRDGGGGVAPNVRQAVLSRARHLSDGARELLDLVAVVPDKVELSLLEEALGTDLSSLDECIDRGLLQLSGDCAAFRHEIARRALEDALPDLKRIRLNRKVVGVLATRAAGPDILTRLAHHAIAAKDADAIVAYVPEAAHAATGRGAHREAAALFAALQPYAERMAPSKRALFYEQHSQACFLVNQGAGAVAMSEAAYQIWEQQADALAMGRNLVRRSDILWVAHPMRLQKLRGILPNAIRVLETLPPSQELALAYAAKAVLLGWEDHETAAALRMEAVRLAEAHGDVAALAEVLERNALSEQMSYGLPTEETLEYLHRHSIATGNDRGILAAHHFRAVVWGRNRNLERFAAEIDAGLRFAEERQLDQFFRAQFLRMMATDIDLAGGDWAAVERDLTRMLERADVPEGLLVLRTARLIKLGGRQRENVDTAPLRAALRDGARLLPNDLLIGHLANAEVAWIAGDVDEARRSAAEGWRIAERITAPWLRGDVAFWLWVVGDLPEIPDNVAEPFVLQFQGKWRAAAHKWKSLGYAYEEGLSLLFGDESGQRDALGIFERLGAKATAARCRERMREQGIRNIPRGPTANTRSNPSGLTDREQETLALLAQGLTNADIAKRIHRAVRTVDHHVAAVIDKIGVRNRHEAVTLARKRGWLVD